MTAVLFSFVVGISLGMGLGVCGTLWILWKRGVFKAYDMDKLVSQLTEEASDFKWGGSE